MTNLEQKAKEIKFEPKVELIESNGIEKLYLYGSIVEDIPMDWWTGEEMKGDFITMNVVKEAFNQIKGNSVELHINSRGGDVYTSVAIGNFIKDSGKNVTVVIDSIAASGASIIAMSGNKIKMHQNSMMMIHRASVMTYGNAEELIKIAANLEKFDETVLNSYKGHFKGETEELKKLIWNETYLTANDCLTLGLCDEIITKTEKEEATEKVENKEDFKLNLLAKYRNKDTLSVNNTDVKVSEEKENKNLLNKFKGE